MIWVNPNEARNTVPISGREPSGMETSRLNENISLSVSRINNALSTREINDGITSIFSALIKKALPEDRLPVIKSVYQQLASQQKKEAFAKAIAQKDGALLPETALKNFESWIRGTAGQPLPSASLVPSQSEGVALSTLGVMVRRPAERIAAELKSSGVGTIVDYAANTQVITAGEIGNNDVYFILEGSADVELKGEWQPAGRDGMFGEIGPMTGMPRTANVRAGEKGLRVLKLDWGALREWLGRESNAELRREFEASIKINVINMLDQQVKLFNVPMEEIFLKTSEAGKAPQGSLDIGDNQLISANELLKVYHSRGEAGVKDLLTAYFVDLAMKGKPQGLRLWCGLAGFGAGQLQPKDFSSLIEYISKGQTHLHPTRSYPLDYIYQIGRESLGDAAVWAEGEAKLTPKLREILKRHGFSTLREVFAGADRTEQMAALKELITYQPAEGEQSLKEYLEMLSPSVLVRTPEQIERGVFNIAESQYSDGVRYLELRFSPFREGMTEQQLETVIRSYVNGLRLAMKDSPGLEAKAIMIFDTSLTAEQAADLAGKIEKVLSKPENRMLLDTIVGFDTAGPEIDSERLGTFVMDSTLKKRYYFDLNKFGMTLEGLCRRLTLLKGTGSQVNLTVHAGENFLTVEQGFENVERAIGWGARRLGHGLVLGIDADKLEGKLDGLGIEYDKARVEAIRIRQDRLLTRIFQEHIVIESCPTSNTHTQMGVTYDTHPIRKFREYNIAFTISTDNSTTDFTRVSNELAQVARGQKMSLAEFLEMTQGTSMYRLDQMGPARDYFTGMTPREMGVRIFDLTYAGKDLFVQVIPQAVAEMMQQEGSTYTEVGFFEIRGDRAVLVSSNSPHLNIHDLSVDIRGKTKFEQIKSHMETLELLNGRSGSLRFVPVYGHNKKLMGIISVGGDRNVNIDNVEQFSKIVAGALRMNERFQGYRTNGLGMNTRASFIRDAHLRLAKKGRIQTLVINMSLKAVNSLPNGHEKGNSVMIIARAAIERACLKYRMSVDVTKDGVNMATVIDRPVDEAAFMAEIRAEIGNSVRAELAGSGAPPEVIEAAASRVNVGMVDYVPQRDGVITAEDLWLAVEEKIIDLNQRPAENLTKTTVNIETIKAMRANMVTRNKSLSIDILQRQRLFREALQRIRTEVVATVGKSVPRRVIGDVTKTIFEERYLDLDTKLPTHMFLDEYVAKLGRGRTHSAAFFDLNKISAFIKTFGSEGHRIADFIMIKRFGREIQNELMDRFNGEILLVRHGPRSEEFYLVGEVTPERMSEAIKFVGEVLGRPLEMDLNVEALRGTAEGREYLERYKPEIRDGRVSVDLTKLVRGEPGSEARYIGLTLTGAYGQMRSEADLRAIISAGENAKGQNPERDRNLVLSPDEVRRYASEFESTQRADREQAERAEKERSYKAIESAYGRDVADNVRSVMESATPENIKILEQRLAEGIRKLSPARLAQELNITEVQAGEILKQADRAIKGQAKGELISTVVGLGGMTLAGKLLTMIVPDMNPGFHFAAVCVTGHYITTGGFALAQRLKAGQISMQAREALTLRGAVRAVNPFNVILGIDMAASMAWNGLYTAVGDAALKRMGASRKFREGVREVGSLGAFMARPGAIGLARLTGRNIVPSAGVKSVAGALGAYVVVNQVAGLETMGLQALIGMGNYERSVIARAAAQKMEYFADASTFWYLTTYLKKVPDFFGASPLTDMYWADPAQCAAIMENDSKMVTGLDNSFRGLFGNVLFNEATTGILDNGNKSSITPANREAVRAMIKAAIGTQLRSKEDAEAFEGSQEFLRYYSQWHKIPIPKELIELDISNFDQYQPSDEMVEWAVRRGIVTR